MTMILPDMTARKPFPIDKPPAIARLLRALRNAIAAWATRRAMRRAEAELMVLDDRTLKDIGLVRQQIGSALIDRSELRDRFSRLPIHRL